MVLSKFFEDEYVLIGASEYRRAILIRVREYKSIGVKIVARSI